MDFVIVIILFLLLIVTLFIAVKMHYLHLDKKGEISVLLKQNELTNPPNKGSKNTKSKERKNNVISLGELKKSNELKKFNAKEVSIKRIGDKKSERISIDEFKRKKKIYGKDAYEVVEYHE